MYILFIRSFTMSIQSGTLAEVRGLPLLPPSTCGFQGLNQVKLGGKCFFCPLRSLSDLDPMHFKRYKEASKVTFKNTYPMKMYVGEIKLDQRIKHCQVIRLNVLENISSPHSSSFSTSHSLLSFFFLKACKAL